MNTTRWILGTVAVPVVTYYSTTFVQVVFHRWFGHESRLPAVYSNHLHGHHADYRADRLTSDTWIEAERHVMWYYALPLAPLSAAALWLLPWPLGVLHVATLAATIWWHLHLHKHYHLNVTPWARFAWFRRKRELHLRHHVRHHGNYAIVEFFWDRLLGTYDRAPLPSRGATPPLCRPTNPESKPNTPMKTITRILTTLSALALSALSAFAGGVLTPVGSPHNPIQIRSHQVNVVINNGFAQTEVLQTFFNPNPQDLEAVYSFPVPKSASLSEVTITSGERTLNGEVLPKKDAEAAYEDEKSKGNDSGLATKNGYQTFEFKVAPVRANAEVKLRFVYYQPLDLDTGVGRYLYPLEDGGTDEIAKSFWTASPQVEGELLVNVELKSAVPVADVRVPGFETAATTKKLGEGHYQVSLSRTGAKLDRDFVFYYRLADNLPGRVEVIPYRASADKPGTFMMVVTPGVDLQPIKHGADYVYVLDNSGSMQGKLGTLTRGVAQALGQMRPEDRFRVVVFSERARELIPWTAAAPEAVKKAVELVGALGVEGGTNLYAGIAEGLRGLDADRATSLVLVTDGVANTGLVQPAEFAKLLKQYDVRVFGFLMGNSANWPLLRLITDTTGGFYAPVSNDDDIVGQLLLAKSKITFESMHGASFKFSGVRVTDTTGDTPEKIYRGQQLVLFGRYEGTGPATVTLQAKLTGADKTYTTKFDFPAVDTDNPEIERLWAMAQIEQIEQKELLGQVPATETKDAITNLGTAYQIVTDHTAMVVMSDESFAQRGIERRNQQRTALERTAQTVRSNAPIKSYHVDAQNPTFPARAPHISHGGGAIDRGMILLISALLVFATYRYYRRVAAQDDRKK